MAKTRVYYNGAFPVCDAGTTQQRKWLEPFEVDIEWIDVHRDNIAVAQLGAELEFVRERLHVFDAAGETHIGTEAFAALWLLSPRQRCLGPYRALARHPART